MEKVDKMELGSICSYIINIVIDYFYAMPYAYPRQDKTRQTNYGLVALRKVKSNFNFSKIPRIITTLLLIFSLILQNLLFNISPVYAASSPWSQTDWSGGSGQTSWSDNTKFDSSSSVTTSTAGQLILSATSGWCSNASSDSSWKYRKKLLLTTLTPTENLEHLP